MYSDPFLPTRASPLMISPGLTFRLSLSMMPQAFIIRSASASFASKAVISCYVDSLINTFCLPSNWVILRKATSCNTRLSYDNQCLFSSQYSNLTYSYLCLLISRFLENGMSAVDTLGRFLAFAWLGNNFPNAPADWARLYFLEFSGMIDLIHLGSMGTLYCFIRSKMSTRSGLGRPRTLFGCLLSKYLPRSASLPVAFVWKHGKSSSLKSSLVLMQIRWPSLLYIYSRTLARNQLNVILRFLSSKKANWSVCCTKLFNSFGLTTTCY